MSQKDGMERMKDKYPIGVYVYRINYQGLDSEGIKVKKKKLGTFTLLVNSNIILMQENKMIEDDKPLQTLLNAGLRVLLVRIDNKVISF